MPSFTVTVVSTAIEPEVRPRRMVEIINRLQKVTRPEDFQQGAVFDGRSILFSTVRLPLQADCTVISPSCLSCGIGEIDLV